VRGEIAILKKLQHQNIVKLYEVLDDPDNDYLYMVFELCERGCIIDISMDTVAKPLIINDARNYFRQMILGIEYLHEQSICHRDIKPDNMMISKDGILKIVDFGVSEMFNKNDKSGKEAGSPGILKNVTI
jgi:serine/threonine protein kinase